jgi:ankyrin repeat protein
LHLISAKIKGYLEYTNIIKLFLAASIQNTEMINFLIQHGSDPNLHIEIEGQEFDTPLIMAYHLKQDKNQEMENNNLATTNEIKKKYDLTKPDFDKMMEDSINALLYHNADPFEINNVGVSSIMKAAKKLDLKMIRNMCQIQQLGKHDINTPNETNETTLMMIVDAIRDRKELKVATDTEMLSLLLKAGADINKQFENGDTVLLKVIRMGSADVLNAVLNSAVVPIKHEVQNKRKFFFFFTHSNKNKMSKSHFYFS